MIRAKKQYFDTLESLEDQFHQCPEEERAIFFEKLWRAIMDVILDEDGKINWWKIIWNLGRLVAQILTYNRLGFTYHRNVNH